MRAERQFALVAAFFLGLGLGGASAQTNLSAISPKRDGEVIRPEQLTVTDVSTTSSLRPDRPERKPLPPAVLERVQDFKRDARKYLEQREALRKQLEGANERERALIRRQLEDERRRWLARAREMRREFKERQAELMDKMPDYREVIDSARNAAQEQAHQVTRPGRDR